MAIETSLEGKNMRKWIQVFIIWVVFITNDPNELASLINQLNNAELDTMHIFGVKDQVWVVFDVNYLTGD